MPDGMPSIDPDKIASRIAGLLAERRPGAVKPLLAALVRLAPDYENLALLRANYWCQMQDMPQALAVLAEAIALQPGNAALWLRQAELCFAEARYADAAQSAAQAVLLAPGSGSAKSRLGLALMQLGQFDQALSCLGESFAGDPANVDVALALAALSPIDAVDILKRAITARPDVTLLQSALTRRYLCCGDTVEAMRIAQQAIANGIADAQIHCLLAFVRMQEADWDEAADSIARAQSIAPENQWAARLLAALSNRKAGRLDPVTSIDAGIAEQELISGGTIVPGAFRSLIEESKIAGPVLDLFCGTGLNAIAARGLDTGLWSGIDPRRSLIESCADRGLYATLREADPLQALAAGSKYPVILLNEALATRESLEPWFDAIGARLAIGGIALAAIPTGRSGLNGHGFFAHGEANIAQYAACAGLSFEISRSGILRHLEGIPIHGVIAAFRAV